MAASDAKPVPLKNTAFRAYVWMRDNDGDLVSGAAALDSEVSIDGGAFTDCTNEATDEGQGQYSIDLTASEMNGDHVGYILKTTTTDAKSPTADFYPQEADDIKVSVTHWAGTAVATPTIAGVPEVDVTHLNGVAQSLLDLKDFADDGYDPSTNKVQGVVLVDTLTTYTGNTPQTGDSFARLGAPVGASISADLQIIDNFLDTEIAAILAAVDTEVAAILADTGAIKAKTDNLPVDPADASVLAGLIAALEAKVDIIDDFLDTEILAIKSKTDNLPASPAAVGSAMTLEAGERAAVADRILGRSRAGGADGGRTVGQALAILRNKWSIAGGILTVTEDDDTTPLYTATVTTAASDPVQAVDPA